MTRFLTYSWLATSILLFGRAYGAQKSWEEALLSVGSNTSYQTAAIVMSVVAALSLLVSSILAFRPQALQRLGSILLTGMLSLYALLMLALGMHRYEPAYSTIAVVVLLLAGVLTCSYAVVLRARSLD